MFRRFAGTSDTQCHLLQFPKIDCDQRLWNTVDDRHIQVLAGAGPCHCLISSARPRAQLLLLHAVLHRTRDTAVTPMAQISGHPTDQYAHHCNLAHTLVGGY
jgi:hypothetical protein